MAPSPPRERRVKVGVRLRPFTKNEKVRAGGKAAWTWYVWLARSSPSPLLFSLPLLTRTRR